MDVHMTHKAECNSFACVVKYKGRCYDVVSDALHGMLSIHYENKPIQIY